MIAVFILIHGFSAAFSVLGIVYFWIIDKSHFLFFHGYYITRCLLLSQLDPEVNSSREFWNIIFWTFLVGSLTSCFHLLSAVGLILPLFNSLYNLKSGGQKFSPLLTSLQARGRSMTLVFMVVILLSHIIPVVFALRSHPYQAFIVAHYLMTGVAIYCFLVLAPICYFITALLVTSHTFDAKGSMKSWTNNLTYSKVMISKNVRKVALKVIVFIVLVLIYLLFWFWTRALPNLRRPPLEDLSIEKYDAPQKVDEFAEFMIGTNYVLGTVGFFLTSIFLFRSKGRTCYEEA
jgi:hypothetical protein